MVSSMIKGSTRHYESWTAVKFELNPEQEDLAAWLLIKCGAHGCETKPANSGRITLTACFEKTAITEEQLGNIKASLEEYGLADCLNSFCIEVLKDEDWLTRWKEGFEPFTVGNKFLICPAWLKDEFTSDDSDKRIVIYIEPGLAFGTGLHATTQFCLRAIESHDLGANILDVGTGSGILAIACAKLTQCKAAIYGIDINEMALQSASTNCQLNNVTNDIRLLPGSVEAVANERFDTILSNLTCEDIVALLPDYLGMLTAEGIIIASGILKEKLPMLESALLQYPFEITALETADKIWAGAVLNKRL